LIILLIWFIYLFVYLFINLFIHSIIHLSIQYLLYHCDWQGQRPLGDGELVDDAVKENSMLRAENLGLRQKLRASQDTVELLTTRNSQLQADRDRLAISATGTDSSCSNSRGLVVAVVVAVVIIIVVVVVVDQ